MPFKLTVNGKTSTVDADADTPLLWILRDHLGLTGTKFGCGAGICGACTVLDGATAVRSCQITAADATGKRYTTIEGLAGDRCQRAWIEEDVAQCGYCQPGMIVECVALLRATARPTDAQIDDAIASHICRCGTYPRIRKAVHLAASLGKK
jgi:isoquinoline 1-oxidoreductase subunit alpha